MFVLSTFFQITNNLQAVACRATWRVKQQDVELARFQIASKRLLLDDAVSSINGVQFFFSSITSVCSNAKSSGSQDGETNADETYPAVAYFIVFRQCEGFNENILFATLHNQDVEPEIKPIRVRTKAETNNEMETAARQLFQVVKDHNNATIQAMLEVSNVYCYRNAEDTSTDDESQENIHFLPRHFPLVPCRLVVINQGEFETDLYAAAERLESDGLVVHLDTERGVIVNNSSTSDVATTIKRIHRLMYLCDHALYRSDIYAKPENARVTFVKMMDVTSYLHKLLANEALRDKLVQHFQSVERILSHPACEIVQQIQFDLDLIEVSNGFCFSIRSRTFVVCPIPASMNGKLSPRAFIPYDCSTQPQPAYFREGIINSFPDADVRVNFLNKFYQCLLASKMPHKVKKLVVVGPKDSGKTSWSNIFHRIIPPGYIASITNERQFSASMVTNETQLVLVDEWSASTMQSDLAKTILQGGWMVTAVKHGSPRTVLNNSPYYITTNHVPDFGTDDENVERRIQIFNTQSLPETLPGIDRWIYDNAMHCVAWIAEEINANRDMVVAHELWYEPDDARMLTIKANEGETLFSNEQIRRISCVDLREESTEVTVQCQQTIHRRFAAEFRSRRLARKRNANREHLRSASESADNDENRTNFLFSITDDDHPRAERVERRKLPSSSTITRSDDPGENVTDYNQGEEETTGMPLEPNNAETNEQPTSLCAHNDYVEDDQLSQQPLQDTPNTDEQPLASTIHHVLPVYDPPPKKDDCGKNATPSTSSHIGKDDAPLIDRGEPSTSRVLNDHTSAAEEDEEQEMDSCDMKFYSPPSGWVLNDKTYMAKVFCLIKNNLLKDLQRGDLWTFREQRRRAELRRNKKERDFWTQADPKIDAWMLITGRKREVFDVTSFAHQHPHSVGELERVRKIVNVLVLPSRCPVAMALADPEVEGGQNEDQEVDSQGEPRRPQLSSQSYWTKIKKWTPW